MRLAAILATMLMTAALTVPAAEASFGFKSLDVTFTGEDGASELEAGRHPYAFTTSFEFNTKDGGPLEFEVPDGSPRDVTIAAIPGLVGTPTATPRCTTLEFLLQKCPAASQVGFTDVTYAEPGNTEHIAFYNLDPPFGVAAKFGFFVTNSVPVTVEAGVNPNPPYNILVVLRNTSQALPVYGAETTIWGNPPGAAVPFLTLPRACEGPLATGFAGRSWEEPAITVSGSAITHNDAVPPQPQGFVACQRLGFEPTLTARATSQAASAPTGMDVELRMEDEGIVKAEGTADSDIKKAVVTLPEGMTANPSLAEGLAACSPAQLALEDVDSGPGEGCPEASKVGSIEAETPILPDEVLHGDLFLATQNDNPFHSLLALYMVIRDRELGVVVKLAGRIDPDPKTGQLTTTFGEPGHELPQVPVSRVNVHLREGGRSPLISPPSCGTHTTTALLTPWANPANPRLTTASFQTTVGVNGGPCPPGGSLPFQPGFEAGALNNAGGQHSPFLARLTRRDGDQDLVRFDALLPPGVSAKLAGVSQCPDAAISQAKAKTGREEQTNPSCPAGSRIGSVLAGAGVGAQLTYVPGSVYLAGPYGGAPLSVVGVVPAVAGPFDVGTVVVRQALRVDPRTAQVTVDGKLSDPIPHILAGIPLAVRDVRVLVDRPDFTLNPTSCRPMEIGASIWGGGTDPFSLLDDAPVARTVPFQAADCSSLAFGPKLGIQLQGATERGGYPALRALYTAKAGHANLRRMALTFPRSEFVENAHFRTICTRVQFAKGACPQNSIYGRVKAWTPLLDEPLRGPVYLRSSDNLLPDAVFVLHGLIDAEVAVQISSHKGRLVATVPQAPDVPVSRVIVQMQGGGKGLFVNSRSLCRDANRGRAELRAQNEERLLLQPRFRALGCGKGSAGGRGSRPR